MSLGLVAIFAYYAFTLATERMARSGVAPPELLCRFCRVLSSWLGVPYEMRPTGAYAESPQGIRQTRVTVRKERGVTRAKHAPRIGAAVRAGLKPAPTRPYGTFYQLAARRGRPESEMLLANVPRFCKSLNVGSDTIWPKTKGRPASTIGSQVNPDS